MKLAVLALALSLGIFGACTKEQKQDETASQQAPATAATANPSAPATTASGAAPGTASAPAGDVDLTTDSNGLSKATVVMKTSRGVLKFKLFSKDAPNTVKRFVELTQQKFFNGQSFHRVVQGFVAQTGDPKSRNKNDTTVGTGGSGQKLKAEFNGRRHVRGTVAMARGPDPDSADSQFYIAMNSFPHLDNSYTVFGMVVDFGEKTSGQDVLERIKQGDDVIDIHIE